MFAAMLIGGPITAPVFAATQLVDSIVSMQAAIVAAQAGDTIVLKNGTYKTTEPILVACAGTAEAPVTIRAEETSSAELGGTHGFKVQAPAAWVVIAGFRFVHAAGTGNLLWQTAEAGDLPADGFITRDPKLAPDVNGIRRLQQDSPAIDSAVGDYAFVTSDQDGQSRSGKKDRGADEFSSERIVARPLMPADVGPRSQ
jgi:hypothetical protein